MDAAVFLPKHYQPGLVLLSIGVAVMSGYAALDLTDRVYAAQRRFAWIWLAAGAVTLGSGIWSMHFIGMLALMLPLAMSYAPLPTALSWLMAVAGSAAALRLACRARLDRAVWLAGSGFMALAIVSMHYTGMYAMEIEPGIVYDPLWVAFSVLVALTGSAAALGLSFSLRAIRSRLRMLKKAAAAVFMGAAITGMHYSGMAAAEFPVASHAFGAAGVNTTWLALLISSLSVLLLAATLLASALDRRLETQTADLIASLRQANEQLRHGNHHDALTGLANRKLFDQRLEAEVERAGVDGRGFAVFYIDLDGFKLLNDNLGHRAGDDMLESVARAMRGATAERDTVARLGGDEFVILAVNNHGVAAIEALAQRLLIAIRSAGAPGQRLSASVGWARFPEHGSTAQALLVAADRAMYHAKNNGKNSHVGFRPEMAGEAAQEFDLQRELDEAIDNGEIAVFYQPKYRPADGALCGAEALVRWRHPERGLITPDRFIAASERSGLIDRLECVVLDTVCGQIARWRDAGLAVPRISVNLSAARVNDPRLPGAVQCCLDRYGIEAQSLMFEITESVAITGMLDAVATLKRFARMGVDVALDDFGTGHSSLWYLEKLPIQQLKIDRSFIRELATSIPQQAAIVRSIVTLAHNLGLSVVAEGVETEEQLRYVTELGCDELQGYLFSRAVPDHEFAALLAAPHSASGDLSRRSGERPAAPEPAPEHG